MREASDGPERREARAAAFGERSGAEGVGKGGSAGKWRVVVVGSLLVGVEVAVEELARDHFSRVFRFGSMVGCDGVDLGRRETFACACVCARKKAGAERDRAGGFLGADVVLIA